MSFQLSCASVDSRVSYPHPPPKKKLLFCIILYIISVILFDYVCLVNENILTWGVCCAITMYR